jgi:hypothetical protein
MKPQYGAACSGAAALLQDTGDLDAIVPSMSGVTELGNNEAQDSGVDMSLIDAMLALSPEERLRHNDRMLRTIELLRQGLPAKTADNGR